MTDILKAALTGCLFYIAKPKNVSRRVTCTNTSRVMIKPSKHRRFFIMSKTQINDVTRFEFETGGFMGRKKLILSKSDSGFSLTREGTGIYNSEAEVSPVSSGKAEEFLEKLFCECGIMKLQRKYIDDRILDGTDWEIKIEFGSRRTKKSEGCNMFPLNWNSIIDAIRIIDSTFTE